MQHVYAKMDAVLLLGNKVFSLLCTKYVSREKYKQKDLFFKMLAVIVKSA